MTLSQEPSPVVEDTAADVGVPQARELPGQAEGDEVVTKSAFPAIREIVRQGIVQHATKSLAIWGVINSVAWLFMGQEDRDFLSRLPSSGFGVTFLLYGGLIVGVMMLGFAGLAALTRHASTILLNGVSLICVGIWNLASIFVLIDVVSPYGYTVENPGTFWGILGLCQIVWGVRALRTFHRVGSWVTPKLEGRELDLFRDRLRRFLHAAENPQSGIVKGSITTRGPLGLALDTTTHYTGVLASEMALMVSTKLNDCFEIPKAKVTESGIDSDDDLVIETEGRMLCLGLSPESAHAFKVWIGAEKPVNRGTYCRSCKRDYEGVLGGGNTCPICGGELSCVGEDVETESQSPTD